MPYRLLRYMVRIWDAYFRAHPHAKHLPPVYPIVLHQHHRPWRDPPSLADLFHLPDGLTFPDWLPNLSFQLIDLAALPFSALRQQTLSSALLAIMKAMDLKDPATVLPELFDILDIALDPDRNPELLSRYLQYFVSFTENLDMPTFTKKLTELPNSPMKTKGLTLAQQFINAGREEGQRSALLSTTRRQLIRRFGPLPEDVDAHLATASIPELEALTDQLLDAPSLEVLFPDVS